MAAALITLAAVAAGVITLELLGIYAICKAVSTLQRGDN